MKCVYVRTDLYMKLHSELGRLCLAEVVSDSDAELQKTTGMRVLPVRKVCKMGSQ